MDAHWCLYLSVSVHAVSISALHRSAPEAHRCRSPAQESLPPAQTITDNRSLLQFTLINSLWWRFLVHRYCTNRMRNYPYSNVLHYVSAYLEWDGPLSLSSKCFSAGVFKWHPLLKASQIRGIRGMTTPRVTPHYQPHD